MAESQNLKEIRKDVDRIMADFNYDILENWLFERIDLVTIEVTHLCETLDHSELNWKPAPDVWSVAQVLEHIIAVNTSYFPALVALRAGTYQLSWTAKIPFLPRLFGRIILKSVNPENLRKTRTFRIWEPATSSIDASIVHAFVEHQSELKSRIKSSAGLLVKRTLIGSPANPKIVYTVEDAFRIIVTHELRHLMQAKRILALQASFK